MTLAAPGVTLGQAGRHAQVRHHSTHSCFPWHRLQKMPSHDTNFGLVSGGITFFFIYCHSSGLDSHKRYANGKLSYRLTHKKVALILRGHWVTFFFVTRTCTAMLFLALSSFYFSFFHSPCLSSFTLSFDIQFLYSYSLHIHLMNSRSHNFLLLIRLISFKLILLSRLRHVCVSLVPSLSLPFSSILIPFRHYFHSSSFFS